jgi:hypothetical protein
MSLRLAICFTTALGLLSACDSPKPPPPSPAPAPQAATSAGEIMWRYPEARRVVALGDVHGDLAATRAALRLGGIIDDGDKWIGGDTVLVQTGDVLDRGSDEQAIIDLLLSLEEPAKAAGGAVHLLNGNHELMNVEGDFRYVTPGGFTDFVGLGLDVGNPRLARLPEEQRARGAAFLPGGMYAKKLASHPVVVVVGDTVFAHGGVLPKHVPELDRMNREVQAWLLGGGAAGSRVVKTPDSPVWSRHFSDDPDAEDCALAQKTLADLGVKRMVVGHTVQPRIRPACDEQVWRIDVGMSAAYGGSPEVLEITGGKVKAIGQ